MKSVNFNLESFCSTEREQLQWQSEGLPSDKLSTQNTIIILKVFNYKHYVDTVQKEVLKYVYVLRATWYLSLLIPAHLLLSGLKNTSRRKILRVLYKVRRNLKTSWNSQWGKFLYHFFVVASTIVFLMISRFGKIILIEEIDEICPTLYQILRKELIYQGNDSLKQLLYLIWF